LREFYRVPPEDWLLTTNGKVGAYQRAALADPTKDEFAIEEYVRQWVLAELLMTYKYPREWLGERIIVEEMVPVATADKDADISIKNDRGRTFIFIETKSASVTGGEFERAERQLETYLSATHTATIGLLTNSRTTRVIRKKVNPNDFEYIADIPEHGGELVTKVRLSRDPVALTSDRRVGLEPLPQRTSNLLFEAHSALRDIDGLHDDEALDEICKLLYAKIYDERSATDARDDEEYVFRFQAYGRGSASEVASEIRDLYREACEYDLRIYSQRIPGYDRSRGVFREEIGLSDLALARVVELIQDYSLIDSPVDVKSRAFQRVLSGAIRAGLGQYFTPREVITLAVEVAAPRMNDLILDPFCGSGSFLSQSLEYVLRHHSGADDYTLNEFKMFHLHGIEKSPRMTRVAMTDMLMHEDGHSNIRNTDALLTFDNYPDILALPGDENREPAIFDLVLTNPPFGSLLREEARKLLGRFELGAKKKSLPLEVLAIERCLQFLKPGGKLAIILPDGNLANANVQFVRDWLLQHTHLKGVVSLPGETFAPYGTTTKTSLCFFQKLRRPDEAMDDYKIAFYKIDNIGYDATGRTRAESELGDAITYMTGNLQWEPTQ
jgi:type I restriction enzyme M protein